MDISLLGLSTTSRMGLSEQDAFLSNIGMCMMTLYELDWPSPGGGEGWSPVGDDPEGDREAKGILAYIRTTHQKSDEGYTLKRMEIERLMAKQGRGTEERKRERDLAEGRGGPGAGATIQDGYAPPRETPAIALMRVNCRLTLLLREMVFLARGLRPVAEVLSSVDTDQEDMDLLVEAQEEMRRAAAAAAGDAEEEENARRREKNADDVIDEPLPGYGPQIALEWCRRERTPARDAAARLLVAYFSTLTSHPVGLRGFAAAAVEAYTRGVPAAEITRSLLAPEFDVEGSRRGMFGTSADATKFFALFVTSAYVTAEEEGVKTAAAAAAADPDMFAWAAAPGEAEAEEEEGEKKSGEEMERRRRSVAGMRDSVRAWMAMNRKELDKAVGRQLSMDEDEDLASLSSSIDENENAGDRALDDDETPLLRDDFLASTSITVAALTIQRMVVSFTLQEIDQRRQKGGKDGEGYPGDD